MANLREIPEVKLVHQIVFTFYSLNLSRKGNTAKFERILNIVIRYLNGYMYEVIESNYHWDEEARKFSLSISLTGQHEYSSIDHINLRCDSTCGCDLNKFCLLLCQNKLKQEKVVASAYFF